MVKVIKTNFICYSHQMNELEKTINPESDNPIRDP